MKNIRVRIAPSPTGMPHVGTMWQALFVRSFAKHFKGKFIVRIEDTDQDRIVKGAEQALYDALEWLGLEEDESPRKGGKYGPYKQSERLETYRKYAEKLLEKGHAYYCFCSEEQLKKLREEQKKQNQIPKYDGHCRTLSQQDVKKKLQNNEKYVVRMKIPDSKKIIVNDLLRGEVKFDSNILDEQIILKSDGFPTYHLAVVVDDHLMKISHVVRGEEWLSSAPKHVLLYKYLGWEIPTLVHTPILRNPDKTKLSKRQGHTNVMWFKKQGFLPKALLNFLALLGWSHPQGKEIFSIEEFIKHVHLKDLSVIGPVFNMEKLDWMNGKYIRNLSEKELFEYVKKYSRFPIEEIDYKLILPLLQERIKRLGNVDQWLGFIFEEVEFDKEELYKKGGNQELIKEQFETIANKLKDIEEWETEEIGETLKQIVINRDQWKTGQYFMALRVAITGSSISLPLFESIELLGKEKTLKRLKTAL